MDMVLGLVMTGPVTWSVDPIVRARWLAHCRRYPWHWPLTAYRRCYGEERYREMTTRLRTLRRLHSARERLAGQDRRR